VTVRLLIVSAGTHRLALDVEDVQEIIECGVVTPLPGLPAAIAGVLPIRGRAVPLIDLAAVHGDSPGHDHRNVVVTNDGARPLALLVDTVEQITEDAELEIMLLDPRTLLESLG
jgi:purine-binding chemotaxis protein CheW